MNVGSELVPRWLGAISWSKQILKYSHLKKMKGADVWGTNMVKYLPVDQSKLEQAADTFYSRMNQAESAIVRTAVNGLAAYMESLERGPFLIAGVGGILRYREPSMAEDLDLAVVGLKYTTSPNYDHSFAHVEQFTGAVNTYFMNLISQLQEARVNHNVTHGSGPFKGMNLSFEGKRGDLPIEVRSKVESFGWYNSKGLQVRCGDSESRPELKKLRPLDIQFVFNETPDEWRQAQQSLVEIHGGYNDRKNHQFFYAVLAEQK